MLIETMLDFAGLDYDALDRRLTLDPVLPGPWPHIGLKQTLPLRRGRLPPRAADRRHGPPPQLKARLDHPVDLDVDLTCPDLTELGPWQSSSPMPEPTFDGRTGRIRWVTTLPGGRGEWGWTWG